MHLLSKENIVKWYEINCDTTINIGFLDYMMEIGIVLNRDNKLDLDEINALLLESYNGDFIVDEDDRFIVKSNKKSLIQSFIPKKEEVIAIPITQDTKPKKPRFVIENLGNNKLKLRKL